MALVSFSLSLPFFRLSGRIEYILSSWTLGKKLSGKESLSFEKQPLLRHLVYLHIYPASRWCTLLQMYRIYSSVSLLLSIVAISILTEVHDREFECFKCSV